MPLGCPQAPRLRRARALLWILQAQHSPRKQTGPLLSCTTHTHTHTNVHTQLCTCTHTRGCPDACVHTYAHACTQLHVYTCAHVCLNRRTHAHVCTRAHANACMHVCVNRCTCVHGCTHAHVCVCALLHTYTCVHARTCSPGIYMCAHAYIHVYTHRQSPGAASKSSRATPPRDSGQHVSPRGTQTTFPSGGFPPNSGQSLRTRCREREPGNHQ